MAALDKRASPRQGKRLTSFLDVSVGLTQELDADSIVGVILDRSMELARADYGALVTFDPAGAIDHFLLRGIDDPEIQMGASLRALLSVRDRLIGGLYLSRAPGEPPFSESDRHLVNALGEMATVGLSSARLYREEAERGKSGALMRQILVGGQTFTRDHRGIVDTVETLGKAAGIDRCYIRLIDEDDGELGPIEVEWDRPGRRTLESRSIGELPDRICWPRRSD